MSSPADFYARFCAPVVNATHMARVAVEAWRKRLAVYHGPSLFHWLGVDGDV